MPKINRQHFYFGVILTAILNFNPDASVVLLETNNDTRKVYKIQTNTSNECVIF